MKENKYDKTINSSKEESMQKAFEMLNEEMLEDKEIKRPVINSKQKIFRLLLLILIYVALIAGVIYCWMLWSKIILSIIFLCILLIIIFFTTKKTIIDMVLLYQRFAPEGLRRACRFTPSCSEYMILAIEKYGTVKGVLKGIRRILKCHPPNGGEDYP